MVQRPRSWKARDRCPPCRWPGATARRAAAAGNRCRTRHRALGGERRIPTGRVSPSGRQCRGAGGRASLARNRWPWPRRQRHRGAVAPQQSGTQLRLLPPAADRTRWPSESPRSPEIAPTPRRCWITRCRGPGCGRYMRCSAWSARGDRAGSTPPAGARWKPRPSASRWSAGSCSAAPRTPAISRPCCSRPASPRFARDKPSTDTARDTIRKSASSQQAEDHPISGPAKTCPPGTRTRDRANHDLQSICPGGAGFRHPQVRPSARCHHLRIIHAWARAVQLGHAPHRPPYFDSLRIMLS
jgi:hypothetical protein